jgi:hypothetical protein
MLLLIVDLILQSEGKGKKAIFGVLGGREAGCQGNREFRLKWKSIERLSRLSPLDEYQEQNFQDISC